MKTPVHVPPVGPEREPPAALHLLNTMATFAGASWDAWRAALAALDGMPLTSACTPSSTFNVAKKLSATALSQQLPRRLMLQTSPWARSARR